MVKLWAILGLLALGGCVRSIEDVASLPLTNSVLTEKPMAEVRDCLVIAMNRVRTTPIETGAGPSKTLAFSGDNGVIAVYVLTPTHEGTRVEVRRRKMIADGYGDASRCYAG